MPKVLTNGEQSIGAYMLPDKKKPHICYQDGNKIYDCGRFNNIDSAERFMCALAKLVGVKDVTNDE